MSGAGSYFDGYQAEDQVAALYQRNGFDILYRRWKCSEGEIDIIAGHGTKVYFVEVKKARSHDLAAQRILQTQILRIQNAAANFLQSTERGLNTEMRFDAALVDAQSKIKVVPNAFF